MVVARIALSWLMLGVPALAACSSSGVPPTAASSAPPAASTSVTSPASASPSAGGQSSAADALLGEADRELAAMKTTNYQHATHVDEGTGQFFYDCSGLLDYALGRVLPADAKTLPTSTSVRPLAGDIEQYLHRGLSGPIDGWDAISHVDQLQPGDVVAWLATEDSTTGDTGHVMIVHAAPTRSPDRADEWLVRVVDSTLSPHASDSRRDGVTGLGTGTIGLTTDDGGAPTAFYWKGGVSKHAKPTEIALGRPR